MILSVFLNLNYQTIRGKVILMIEPVNTWIHIEVLQKDDFEDTTAGRVKVLRDNQEAGDVIGVPVIEGLILIVEPSLIMTVGTESFIRATKESIYATENLPY